MSNYGYNDHYPERYEDVVTVKDWLLVMVLMCIPLVNLIMPFVWAFGGGNIPESKRNWARAMLIWALIIIAIYILLFVFVGINMLAPTDYGI